MFISVECFPIWCMQVVNRFINLCMTIHINVIKSPVKKKLQSLQRKFFLPNSLVHALFIFQDLWSWIKV